MLRPTRHLQIISIHALREEGDVLLISIVALRRQFLSTPSARRATVPAGMRRGKREISIHALREEGDLPSMDRRIL